MTLEEMKRLAEASFPAIERDGAKELTERQRKVIAHWMVRAMVDVCNATIDEQENGLRALLEKTQAGRLRL